MLDVNHEAVVVAALLAFVVGAVWNSPLLFGNVLVRLRGRNPNVPADTRMPVGQMLAELVRVLVVAYVLAHFVVLLDVADWWSAVQLAAWLWIGFQAALLAGAVIWEGMPLKLYAIHAGDALLKILLMAVILGVWR